jgi:hypothetical protein
MNPNHASATTTAIAMGLVLVAGITVLAQQEDVRE